MVGPTALTVTAGSIHSVTVMGNDVPEQPAEFVTVTVKIPEAVMALVCVILAFDQL